MDAARMNALFVNRAPDADVGAVRVVLLLESRLVEERAPNVV
jgi:hypothetical protein